jgi:SAM-dependent methyltransferase
MLDTRTICDCVDAVLAELTDEITVNDGEFARRVYADGVEKYAARLRQYGFEGLGHVLDAGCGFGQWSVALSQSNHAVAAIDASAARVKSVNALVRRLRLSDLTARSGTLENLPFDDATFDGVFCYGVIFLSGWKESLAELVRVLRPGGRIYVNANGIGWYKHLWYTQHNRTVDYDPQQIVVDAFRNTLKYRRGQAITPGKDIIIEPDELVSEMARLQLGIVDKAPEGLLGIKAGEQPETPPFFQAEYMGDLGVYEVVALKRTTADYESR